MALLSLEHASGRGLFLIGHQPSVPAGEGGGGVERGSDAAARTGGQRRLSGCVWALHTRSHNCVNWSVHSKEAEPCLIDPQIYCRETPAHTFGQTAAGIIITSHFIPHRESPTFIMQLTWTLEVHVSLQRNNQSAAGSCFKCKAGLGFFFFKSSFFYAFRPFRPQENSILVHICGQPTDMNKSNVLLPAFLAFFSPAPVSFYLRFLNLAQLIRLHLSIFSRSWLFFFFPSCLPLITTSLVGLFGVE